LKEPEINKAIKACQKSSNPKTFRHVYDFFSERVYYTCLRYLSAEADAQDALQETFVTAYTQIHKFKFNGPFGAWICRIAVNHCLQMLREQKKLIHLNEQDPVMEVVDEVADLNELEMRDQHVIQCLNLLPDGYKTILNLFVVEEYSHAQISKLLGIKESTSRSQLVRARKALKVLFTETSRTKAIVG